VLNTPDSHSGIIYRAIWFKAPGFCRHRGKEIEIANQIKSESCTRLLWESPHKSGQKKHKDNPDEMENKNIYNVKMPEESEIYG